MNSKQIVSVIALCSTLVACSKDKEQCHAVALVAIEVTQSGSELRSAAEVGNREGFDKARAQLEAALAKLQKTEVSGKSLKAEVTASTRTRLIELAPIAVQGYEKLLIAVATEPQLGGRYAGGRPPLSAANVGKEVEQSISTFHAATGAAAKRSCD